MSKLKVKITFLEKQLEERLGELQNLREQNLSLDRNLKESQRTNTEIQFRLEEAISKCQ